MIKGIPLVILAVCLVSLLACGPTAPTLTTEPTDLDLDPLRTLLEGFVADEETAGAALLLAHHGNIVFEEAYGLADVEADKAFTTDTIFRIASTTKPLTATCVMILVDEGKISLDDPVSEYIPAFGALTVEGTDAKAPSPTIRQLLSHTSGIFSALLKARMMGIIYDPSLTLEESVDLIAKEEFISEPGSGFTYGSTNFHVAARVVEIVSGQLFDAFMQEHLLDPLGMVDTTFRPSQEQAPRIANIYVPVSDGFKMLLKYNPESEINLISRGHGLYSTVRDLAVFLQMHLNGGVYGSTRILSSAAVAEMQADQTADAEYLWSSTGDKNYGLGFYRERMGPDGKALAVHHGGMYGSFAYIDIDRDLVWVLDFNQPLGGARQLRTPLREQILEIFPPVDSGGH